MNGIIRVTCQKCLEKLTGYTLQARQASECLNWTADHLDHLIVARGTVAVLDENWRQTIHNHHRPVVWTKSHRLILTSHDEYTGSSTSIWHLGILNKNRNLARQIPFCDAPDVLRIDGPGAAVHIEEDAEIVGARDAKQHLDAFTKARKDATAREVDGYCNQLKAAFEALGFKVSAGGRMIDKYSTRLSINPDDATRLLEALGASVAHRPLEPMPVWSVRYGENDNKPLILGARNHAAVIAYMTAHYCDERREDGQNVPLDPAKLRIERLEDPTDTTSESDAA